MPKPALLQMAILLLVSVATLVSSAADEASRLLTSLAGEDETARAEARQLLPRYGMEVVPELFTLMTHGDARVWRAAMNVVADVCHSVGVPGRERERRELAGMLKSVVLGDGPDHTRKYALRMLGITAPEGFRLGSLDDLGEDPAWREEVVSALVVMGTSQARKALNDLLDEGTGAQRAEIIEALRLITPAPDAPVKARLLKNNDAEIRVAAMRALAQTGDEKLVEAFKDAVDGTDGRLHVEAIDACLQYANALLSGDANSAAKSLFQWILDTEQDEALRSGAEAGLKRVANE